MSFIEVSTAKLTGHGVHQRDATNLLSAEKDRGL